MLKTIKSIRAYANVWVVDALRLHTHTNTRRACVVFMRRNKLHWWASEMWMVPNACYFSETEFVFSLLFYIWRSAFSGSRTRGVCKCDGDYVSQLWCISTTSVETIDYIKGRLARHPQVRNEKKTEKTGFWIFGTVYLSTVKTMISSLREKSNVEEQSFRSNVLFGWACNAGKHIRVSGMCIQYTHAHRTY